jgi:hypothetical protein
VRIRIVQKPPLASVDGLRTDWFEPGGLYAVGTALGCLFLAEGWAEPVVSEEPAQLTPVRQTRWDAEDAEPHNLFRGKWPSYLDDFSAASDLERRRRRR